MSGNVNIELKKQITDYFDLAFCNNKLKTKGSIILLNEYDSKLGRAVSREKHAETWFWSQFPKI